MAWLVFALVLVIPGTVPLTALRWLTTEYALGIIWGAFIVNAVLGFVNLRQSAGESAAAES